MYRYPVPNLHLLNENLWVMGFTTSPGNSDAQSGLRNPDSPGCCSEVGTEGSGLGLECT